MLKEISLKKPENMLNQTFCVDIVQYATIVLRFALIFILVNFLLRTFVKKKTRDF